MLRTDVPKSILVNVALTAEQERARSGTCRGVSSDWSPSSSSSDPPCSAFLTAPAAVAPIRVEEEAGGPHLGTLLWGLCKIIYALFVLNILGNMCLAVQKLHKP